MKHLEMHTAWCKGCGVCAAFCPRQVLKIEKGKVAFRQAENCVACGTCVGLCPDFAIYLVESEDSHVGE